jgi:hypothetical protein
MFSLYHAASTIKAGSLLRSVLKTWAGLDLSARTLQSLSSRRYLATSHTYRISVHYQEKFPIFLNFLHCIESISEYTDENLSATVSIRHGTVGQALLHGDSIPDIRQKLMGTGMTSIPRIICADDSSPSFRYFPRRHD